MNSLKQSCTFPELELELYKEYLFIPLSFEMTVCLYLNIGVHSEKGGDNE